MIHFAFRGRPLGRWAAAALLPLAGPAVLGTAAVRAASAAQAPAEPRLDPVRLLTTGLTEEELAEADAQGVDPPRFRVLATMKPFRMTSGPRISTDRAELEASFFPGPPVKLGEKYVNRPVRVDGHLRVFGEGDQVVDWYFEPANFADWSPHVTFDRAQERVSIIAPVALVDAARTHRVPILLALNCRPASDRLVCYRAASVLEDSAAALRARREDPLDALGLHWEPRERRSEAIEGAGTPHDR